MRQFKVISPLVFALLLLSGCEQASQAPAPAAAAAKPVPEAPIDTTRFIRARDLLQRMQSNTGHYVFDVRAEASYAESHILNSLSMPYGKVEPEDVAALAQITPDTPIVTYCGCPHALAGFAADQLTEWGYRNVRVLYEGYWYWRDSQYPIAGAQAQSVTELHLAGVLHSEFQPRAGIQVFIRNMRNGQLEAAITDDSGRFETAFHVLGLRPDDRFEIRAGEVDSAIVEYLALNTNRKDFVVRIN